MMNPALEDNFSCTGFKNLFVLHFPTDIQHKIYVVFYVKLTHVPTLWIDTISLY